MKIVENSILPPKGYKAMTIGPLIFVKKGTVLSGQEVNHESIHWEQYKETFIIGFFLVYVIEFILKFILLSFTIEYKKDERSYWNRVYHSLSMEREAYNHQDEPNYIKERKHFAWLKEIL